MSILKKGLSFSNVSPGSTATINLDIGPTYERFTLNMGGTTFNKTHLTDIRLRVNGRVIHQCSGAELEAMNAFCGLVTDPAFLTLDLIELFARDEAGQKIGALSTLSGVATIALEVDIAGTAVAPTLVLFTVTSAPQALSLVNKVVRYSANIGASGKFGLSLPFGLVGGSLLKRLWIKSANMTAMEMKANGLTIHDSTKAANEFWQKENKKSPQAGYYVVDFTVDNNQADHLNTTVLNSLEINGTFSGAESIVYFGEFTDALGNL
jgi:hypothetical protein